MMAASHFEEAREFNLESDDKETGSRWEDEGGDERNQARASVSSKSIASVGVCVSVSVCMFTNREVTRHRHQNQYTNTSI